MSSNPPPSEPTPLTVILRRFLERGLTLLQKGTATRDGLQTWNSMVRHQLYKIYGKDELKLAYFASLPPQLSQSEVQQNLRERTEHLQRFIERLENLINVARTRAGGNRIFIGHGRSLLWMVLKDFIADRLRLPWDEFNRAPVAGYATLERIEEMLSDAAFAFLVMTAEEEHADATLHARPNVIHEVGLFQGRLGARRAIVLLEEGCSEFSNIVGLIQLRFPKGNIAACFEEIRRLLENESLI